MRILHVVYECTPGIFAGGVQKVVYELAVAQAGLGHGVEIWTIGPPGAEVRVGGALIRYFDGRARFAGQNRFSSEALFHELKERHRGFDVLHGHNTFLPLNRYLAWAARHGAKVFYTPHGALDGQLLAGWSLRSLKKRVYNTVFERPNLNRSRGVIALTATERVQLQDFGVRAPICELGNGITLPKALASEHAQAEFRARLDIAADAPVVLFIGRITAKKGIHFLIEAMAALRQAHPTARLVIAGDRKAEPEYVDELDAAVKRQSLADTVCWAGFLNEQEKPAALATASVFVHCSYSEGMAMAILEAMAHALPCVVTPGCYMGDAVRAGVVLEVSQNPAAIAAAVAALLRDPGEAKRQGAEAREYIKRNHDWSAIAKRLTGLYESVARVDGGPIRS